MKKIKIYCAGPIFNTKEREEMEEIAEILRQNGFDVFLPHKDGLKFYDMLSYMIRLGFENKKAKNILKRAIFYLDAYQVAEDCNAVLVNLNGRIPDEGAIVEGAWSWILGKPTFLFKNDVRTVLDGEDNPMVEGLGNFIYVRSVNQLREVLKTFFETYAMRNIDTPNFPRHIKQILEKGKRIATWLKGKRDIYALLSIVEEQDNFAEGS